MKTQQLNAKSGTFTELQATQNKQLTTGVYHRVGVTLYVQVGAG
jgi:hypothetical protein